MSKLPPTAQQADDQQKQTRHVFPFTPVKHISGLETKKTPQKNHIKCAFFKLPYVFKPSVTVWNHHYDRVAYVQYIKMYRNLSES